MRQLQNEKQPMVHVCEMPLLKKRNKNTPLAHFKTQGAVKNGLWKSPVNFPLPCRFGSKHTSTVEAMAFSRGQLSFQQGFLMT